MLRWLLVLLLAVVSLLALIKLVVRVVMVRFGCSIGRVGWLHLRDIDVRIPRDPRQPELLSVHVGSIGMRFTWQQLRWIHLAILDIAVRVNIPRLSDTKPSAPTTAMPSRKPALLQHVYLWWIAVRFANWVGLTIERFTITLLDQPELRVELERFSFATTFFQLGLRDSSELLTFEGRMDLVGLQCSAHNSNRDYEANSVNMATMDVFSVALSGKARLELLQVEQLELDLDMDRVDVNVRTLLEWLSIKREAAKTRPDVASSELHVQSEKPANSPMVLVSLVSKIRLDVRNFRVHYSYDEGNAANAVNSLIYISWRSFGAVFMLPQLSEVGVERNALMDIQVIALRAVLERASTSLSPRCDTLLAISNTSARLSIDFIETTLVRLRIAVNAVAPQMLLSDAALMSLICLPNDAAELLPAPPSTVPQPPVQRRWSDLAAIPNCHFELKVTQPRLELSRAVQDTVSQQVTSSTVAVCAEHVQFTGSLAPHLSVGSIGTPAASQADRQLSGGITLNRILITASQACEQPATCFSLPELNVQCIARMSALSSSRSSSWSSTFSDPDRRGEVAESITSALYDNPGMGNDHEYGVVLQCKVQTDALDIHLSQRSLQAIARVLHGLQDSVDTRLVASRSTTLVNPPPASSTSTLLRSVSVTLRVLCIRCAVYGPGDPGDAKERGVILSVGNLDLHGEHSAAEPPAVKGYLQAIEVSAYSPERFQAVGQRRRAKRSSIHQTDMTRIVHVESVNIYTEAAAQSVAFQGGPGANRSGSLPTSATSISPIVGHVPRIDIHLDVTEIYALVTAAVHLQCLVRKRPRDEAAESTHAIDKPPSSTAGTPGVERPAFTLELMRVDMQVKLAGDVDLLLQLRCARANHSSACWYADVESCKVFGRHAESGDHVPLLTLNGLSASPNGQTRPAVLSPAKTTAAKSRSPSLSTISSGGSRSDSPVSLGHATATAVPSTSANTLPYIAVSVTSLILSVPHKYRLADVIDNINNTIKSAKFMMARVRFGCAPPHTDTQVDLPRVELRVVDLVFELLDAPFEIALARIFQLGISEQRERITRSTVLDARLESARVDPSQFGEIDEHLAHRLLDEFNASHWRTLQQRHRQEHQRAPSLMRVTGRGVLLKLGPPTFGRSQLGQWVNSLDGCTPIDYRYDLGILMHIHLSATELKMQLRDFPHPLVHFPPAKKSTRHPASQPGIVWEGDLAILEQEPLPCAFRYISVPVCPGVTAVSARTISPVKLFTDAQIRVLSDRDTFVGWGPCVQPTLAELSHIMDTITDPNPDPSPALGWWDKLRLVMHGRLRIQWPNGGALRVLLQGGQHPWRRTLHDAGLVLVWRDRVSLTLGGEERLLELRSQRFYMAIPEVKEQANVHGRDGMAKLLLRLAGDVRIGCVVRLDPPADVSAWLPHHAIITRMSNFVKGSHRHDSFHGFRAGKIHLQFIFQAMQSLPARHLQDSVGQIGNSVHLTPASWLHFMRFVDLFGSEKSSPVRQGRLFPDVTSVSPDFGRHLSSMRFTFALAPLWLSYFIRDDNDEATIEGEEGTVTMRGVKGRVQRFDFDMVLEHYEKATDELTENSMSNTGLELQDAMIDLVAVDARAITVEESDDGQYPCAQHIGNTTGDGQFSNFDGQQASGYATCGDGELSGNGLPESVWIDPADFDDLGEPIQFCAGKSTVTPFIYTPRAAYFKHGKCASPANRISMLGRDVHDVQQALFEARHADIKREIDKYQEQKCLLELQLTLTGRKEEGEESVEVEEEGTGQLRVDLTRIKADLRIAQQTLSVVERHLAELASNAELQVPIFARYDADSTDEHRADHEDREDGSDAFNHRCTIHNAHIIWNVELRNQMFRYMRVLSRQRAVSYYMSPAAVKTIRDAARKMARAAERATALDEVRRQKQAHSEVYDYETVGDIHRRSGSDVVVDEIASPGARDYSPEDLIRQLLGPEHSMEVGDSHADHRSGTTPGHRDEEEAPSDHHTVDDHPVDRNFLLIFVYPQVSFESGSDNSTLVFLAAQQIQLDSLSILDSIRQDNATNNLIKTRTIVHVSDLQLFVAHRIHCLARTQASSTFRYGARDDTQLDGRWQDWLPIELLVDDESEPAPFQRVVQRTSATMYHDKRNPLRIELERGVEVDTGARSMMDPELDEDDSDGDVVTDTVFLHLPSFVFNADALQFTSIWLVFNDLLVYREPDIYLDQVNSILLASETHDYDVIVDSVVGLQEKIRDMDRMLQVYLAEDTLFLGELAAAAVDEYYSLLTQRRSMRDELYVILTTITRLQRLRERRRRATKTVIKAVMTADSIVWQMVDDDSKDPLCECTLQHANLVWVIGDDQSSSNTLEIDRLSVIDRMPNAHFVELLYPLVSDKRRPVDFSRRKMVRVHWRELAPVAGIAVVEHFEINLFPCIVRLTQEIGRRMIAYAFPEKQRSRLQQESSMLQARIDDIAAQASSHLSSTSAGDSALMTSSISAGQSLRAGSDELLPERSSARMSYLHPAAGTDDDSPLRRRRSRSLARSGTLIGGHEQYRSLTQMRTRASQNRTFIYVKVPSTQLCLSYRGRKEKDISNLNDFLFTLPTFEYRNRTCTSLDLLMQVKKDIIWRLLSHTGSLVRGKLFNSKPRHLVGMLPAREVTNRSEASNLKVEGERAASLSANASAFTVTATGDSEQAQSLSVPPSSGNDKQGEREPTLQKRPSLLLRARSSSSRLDQLVREELDSPSATASMDTESTIDLEAVDQPQPTIRRSISNDHKSRLLFGKLYHAPSGQRRG